MSGERGALVGSGARRPPCAKCAAALQENGSWGQYQRAAVLSLAGESSLVVWTRRGEVAVCGDFPEYVHLRGSAAKEFDALFAGAR